MHKIRRKFILAIAGMLPAVVLAKGTPGAELSLAVSERAQFEAALRMANLPDTTRQISFGEVTPRMPYIKCVRSIARPTLCRSLALQMGTSAQSIGADGHDIRWDAANNPPSGGIVLPASIQPAGSLQLGPYAGPLYVEAPKARTLVSCDLTTTGSNIVWQRVDAVATGVAIAQVQTFAFVTPPSALGGGYSDLRFAIKTPTVHGENHAILLGCRFWQLSGG
jgi:hypothetical protein